MESGTMLCRDILEPEVKRKVKNSDPCLTVVLALCPPMVLWGAVT